MADSDDILTAIESLAAQLERAGPRRTSNNAVKLVIDGSAIKGDPGKDATPEQVAEAVENYFLDNPIRDPEDGADASPEQIAEAVLSYFEINPTKPGVPGANVTPEQVAETVRNWMRANPPLKGAPGDSVKGDPGPGLPPGGDTGQIPVKRSDADYDVEWVEPPKGSDGNMVFGGMSPLEVQDEGNVVLRGTTQINFVGSGVAATQDGPGRVKVTVSGGGGGGSSAEILDEGVSLTASPTTIDFVGAGVTATAVGDDVTVTIPGYTDEEARDAIGTALVAGTGIGISVSDAGNTITISNTAPDTTYTDEQAQDAVGTILVDSASIDFTYSDATPSITAIVKDASITFAKMQAITDGKLLGAEGGTVVEEITVGTGLTLSSNTLASSITQYTDELAQDAVGAMVDATIVYTDGTPLLSRAALTGDVTAAGGSNATTVANDAVTFAKMQNIATDSLIGRDTAGTGDPENILLNATLSMDGSGNLQRAALTGAITATAGSNSTVYGDAEILALSGLTSAADKGIQFTGSGTAATYDLTTAGKALLDDADATAQRVTLGLVIGTNVQAQDAELAALAGLTSAADKLPYFTGSGTAGLADFTTFGRSLVDDAAAANAVTTLGLDNTKIAVVSFIIDGGGSAITTGIKGDLEIPFACTINRATVLLDQSGSIVIDIWKDTYANYPPTVADTITASAKPTVSSATKAQDSTLTGWTTSITAGDTLRFNVDSITTATRALLALKVTKT